MSARYRAYIKSGSIGINITRTQKTARAPYLQLIAVVQGYAQPALYHSDVTGFEIVPSLKISDPREIISYGLQGNDLALCRAWVIPIS